MVSIFSPKGGVGKTTITLALAEVLTRKGSVCVIEFDFSPGDFATILNLSPKHNIIKAIYDDLDGAIQRPAKKNYDVIVGGMPDDYHKITMESFNTFMEKIKTKYDYILLDIQPGFVEPCIDAVNSSSKVLIIVEDTLPTVARVNGFLDWLTINNLSSLSNFLFVRNKATTREPLYLSMIRYKLPIIESIPTFKNFKGIGDKRLLKYAGRIAEVIVSGSYRENKPNKKFFLFFRRRT